MLQRSRRQREIEAARHLVREVPAASNVIDYAPPDRPRHAPAGGADDFVPPIVRQWVKWGAGPRAGQALVLGAKARALLNGRSVASLDDVRAVALPVLRHRVLLNFQAEADGVEPIRSSVSCSKRSRSMTVPAASVLDPSLLGRIGDLELVARILAQGLVSGLHRSPFHGYSAEFSQYPAVPPRRRSQIRGLETRGPDRSASTQNSFVKRPTSRRCWSSTPAVRWRFRTGRHRNSATPSSPPPRSRT